MNNRLRRFLTGTSLVVATGMSLLWQSADARTWTSTDGKSMNATFLGMEGEKFKFKMPNGSEIAVDKSRFIKADHEAAERLAKIGDDTLTMLSAKRIDSLLAQQLVKQDNPATGQKYKSFNNPLPDDLFVRRVYLDIIGRIPTRKEFLAFAESARADKRQALIDDLLLSPGFSSHMFNYFADMYRLNSSNDFNNGIRMDPYINWWRESLKENKKYDQIVREMITAKGNVGQNPASGFILRDTGMEFDAFANFGQVMMGIDISCAQCHDHPFQEWTQIDFYKMAAFFGNTQRTARRYGSPAMMMSGAKVGLPGAPEGWMDEVRKFAGTKGIRFNDQQSARQFNYYMSALGWNVADNDTLETVLPHDFAEKGGDPGDVVDPSTLLGATAKMGGKTRREALADWLTAPDNPRFALAIANRMWDRAFGRALIIPVNDFSDEQIGRASQPEVLKHVTREMQRVNYDLREFMRILYNTRAYQSLSTMEEPDWADAYYFPGPVLRRLRAEQTWDSFMVLSEGTEVDSKRGADGSFYKSLLDLDFASTSPEQIWERYQAWDSNRGRRMGQATVSEAGSLEPQYKTDEMVRASELQQPAAAASVLDTFGQSDRLITDEHNYDGSVPQVLALMNGSFTNQLTGLSSKIVDDLEELDGPDDKVRGVFFTLLNRFPTDDELKLGMTMMEDFGEDDGISDLAWALMNSPEFLFIQ